MGAAQAPGSNVIKVLCSTALRTVMQELVPEFERSTGNKVTVEYGVSAAMQRRVEAGEPFDAIFLTVKQLDALVQEGKIAPGTRTAIARSGMAIAIHAGAARPDIKTMDALKRTLLAAKSIAYAKEGASGLYFMALAKRLGIVDSSKLKGTDTETKWGSGGQRGGGARHALSVSEILPEGHRITRRVPEGGSRLRGQCRRRDVGSKQAGAATALIKFLTAPAAAPVIRKKGMEPER
jgi:molybdate transport system substrate-binding protein